MRLILGILSKDIDWNLFTRDGSCPHCGSRYFLNSTPKRNRVVKKDQLILSEYENTCGDCKNVSIAITDKPLGQSAKHYQFAIL